MVNKHKQGKLNIESHDDACMKERKSDRSFYRSFEKSKKKCDRSIALFERAN